MRLGPMFTRLLLVGGTGLLCLAGWSSLSVQYRDATRLKSDHPIKDDLPSSRTRDDLMTRGRNLLDAADFAGAIAALDRVLEHSPADAEALALQVRAFRALRQYRSARLAAARILERFPLSPLAHVLIGSIAVQEGDAFAARLALTRATELDTSSAQPVAQLAALDLMEGKIDDARRRATQSLALDPAGAIALRTLLKVTRSVPVMIALSSRLIALNPDDNLTRSWVEVLRRAQAPEVNYLAPVDGNVTVACERGSDGRFFTQVDAPPLENLRFLIDTGASGLVLSEKRARQMGMTLREFSWSAGVGGAQRHSHPILMSRLMMGGLRAREILATASDLPDGIDGIINPLIFTPAGSGLTLTLNTAESTLFVTKHRLLPAMAGRRHPGGWITMPFLADDNRVIVRVALGGAPAMALLDTGAAVEIVDRFVVSRVPGISTRAEPAGSEHLTGFGGPVEVAAIEGRLPLRIAGADLENGHFLAVDLNTEPFRFQVDLDAIIGIGGLADFDLAIDMSSGLVAFRKLSS